MVPDATICPDWIAYTFDIWVVVPEILLLTKSVKLALVKFVVELMRLYANVAPVKLADVILTPSRMQFMSLAFAKFTPDKFVPVKS